MMTNKTQTVTSAISTLALSVVALVFLIVEATTGEGQLTEGGVSFHVASILSAIFTIYSARGASASSAATKTGAALIVLIMLSGLSYGTPGCIPREVVAKDSIEIVVTEDDDSCEVVILADGKTASKITAARCYVGPAPVPAEVINE